MVYTTRYVCKSVFCCKTGELPWQAIGLVEGMVLLLVAHTVREGTRMK